jgi:hypothetical protein
MNTLEALRLTEALLGMSLVVQTLEHVWTRRALGPNGVWDWAVVRDEFAALPAAARAILDALLGPLGFGVVLGLRAAAALALDLQDVLLVRTLEVAGHVRVERRPVGGPLLSLRRGREQRGAGAGPPGAGPAGVGLPGGGAPSPGGPTPPPVGAPCGGP